MRETDIVDLWAIEKEKREQGFALIAGVDEAGRGPLAGPVCAAAVLLPFGLEIPGLNDSKKLTDKKRSELYDVIVEKALAYGIAMVDEKVIDEINILQATFRAMEDAMLQLKVKPDLVLIDGNRSREFPFPVETVVKGDSLSANIAAASILAKVTRDRFMEKMALEYPDYGFEIHKGYGTKAHYAAIEAYGPSTIHRRTFLRKFYGEK